MCFGLRIVVLTWELVVVLKYAETRRVFIRQIRTKRISVVPLPNHCIVTRPRNRSRCAQVIGMSIRA